MNAFNEMKKGADENADKSWSMAILEGNLGAVCPSKLGPDIHDQNTIQLLMRKTKQFQVIKYDYEWVWESCLKLYMFWGGFLAEVRWFWCGQFGGATDERWPGADWLETGIHLTRALSSLIYLTTPPTTLQSNLNG